MSDDLEKKNNVEKEISEFLKTRDKKGNTLLHYVVKTDNVEFAKNLIAAGCGLNGKNNEGYPPLIEAIRANKVEMVKILLKSGAIHENDYFLYNRGPLHVSAQYGYVDIVLLLIDFGVDVSACTEYNETALHYATGWRKGNSNDYCRIIKALVNAGADVNVVDKYGVTPLLEAFRGRFDAGFELLLTMGSDIRIKGKMDFRFLEAIANTYDLDRLKRLIELGFDINMANEKGDTLLHLASGWSESELVEYLLHNGAVIKVNDNGMDPLGYASSELILGYEYRSETSDHDQKIEENYAECYMSDTKIFNLLIKHGANVNQVDKDGKTPLYIILRYFTSLHSDFLRILLKNGAKFDFEHPLVREVMNNTNGSKFPQLLLRHTAMFEAQDRSDGPANFDLDKLNKKWRKDYASCRDELELMKSTKIDDTNVSFFNVLVKRDIGPYTRNEKIANVFETSTVSKLFPIYSDLICERFSEEIEFQKLAAKAKSGLGHILNWDVNSSHMLISIILCYLNEKDLTTLASIL